MREYRAHIYQDLVTMAFRRQGRGEIKFSTNDIDLSKLEESLCDSPKSENKG